MRRKPRFGEYFIADVSWRPSNPIHRVIALAYDANHYTVYGFGYEYPRDVCPSIDLHYFKLVERIVNMKTDMVLPPGEQTVDSWKRG